MRATVSPPGRKESDMTKHTHTRAQLLQFLQLFI